MALSEPVFHASLPRKHEGRRVLLVDDARLFSIAVRERLEAAFGITVVHCDTMTALGSALRDAGSAFDLAIVEVRHPDAPGGQALEQVLKCGLDAIVFTSISSDAMRTQLRALHDGDFIAKSSIRWLDDLMHAVDRRLSASSKQLLLIEPDAAQAHEFDLLLDGRYPLLVTNNEREAVAALDRSDNIELVLLRASDVFAEDGGLVARLRRRFSSQSIRIVGYSAKAGSDDVARFLRDGGDDFFHLPISADNLLGRLDHTLALHRQILALQHLASRDYLTGLLNRRYFYDRCPGMVDRCLKGHVPCAFALLDIDMFKTFNDTYGHEIGDVVLKAVARRLASLVDDERHVLARFGGEEFAILFTGLESAEAFAYCDALREDISKVQIVVDDETVSVTISVGLASISSAEAFDNYLNAADQYLYLAKHSGRNKVVSDSEVALIMAS